MAFCQLKCTASEINWLVINDFKIVCLHGSNKKESELKNTCKTTRFDMHNRLFQKKILLDFGFSCWFFQLGPKCVEGLIRLVKIVKKNSDRRSQVFVAKNDRLFFKKNFYGRFDYFLPQNAGIQDTYLQTNVFFLVQSNVSEYLGPNNKIINLEILNSMKNNFGTVYYNERYYFCCKMCLYV